ncbi:MAG: peptidylprolyl isomerase, partial [Sulfurimicrobium sp.]|nr:peptidylprolyl isomerase [Sulfurimicrobium sp.]
QQLGLKVEQSGWVTRLASDTPLLNSPKLLQAVFTEEVLKNKRNTEAVEVVPNTLVAARMLEYKAASVKPLEEVSAALGQRLQRQQASVLAVKWGKDALAQLQQGNAPAGLAWSQPQLVSRAKPADLTADVLKETFRAKADKLPAYIGIENNQGGYTLVKVTRLVEGAAMEEARKQAYAQRFANMLEREYATAYLASLKQKTKVEIRKDALEKAER